MDGPGSGASFDDVMEHFGVKGMHWGVRNQEKRVVKGDRKFEKRAGSLDTFIRINNTAALKTNTVDVPRINNKPNYKNADFTKDTPLRRKYYKEHQNAHLKNLEEAAKSFGTNPSGTKKYTILERPDGTWAVTLADVVHSSETFTVNVLYKDGHIVSIQNEEPMTHSDVDDLEHFGVKGMHWGVSRKRSSGVVSADSKRVSEQKSIIKSHGTRALSNKELQDVVTRMNLEQQYSGLKAKQPTKFSNGKKAIAGVLAVGATLNSVIAFANSPAGKIIRQRFAA